MRKRDVFKIGKPTQVLKEPIKHILMSEGKFIHGVKGKPTRGPRGNKKY
jgi:hypothetical protein